MKRTALAAIGISALLAAAHAQETNETTQTYTLPEVIVSPARILLDAPDAEALALDISKTEFAPEQIRLLNPASGAEALKFAPGIHEETRGRKYKQFYSFRGQIYPYPDYAFDGIWQRDARELVYIFPGAWLDRVDITRSSSTLFYGLADVVGVIDFKPRRPGEAAAEKFVTDLGFEAGSLGTYRAYGLTQRGAPDSNHGNLGAQFYSTEGLSGRNAAERLSSAFGSFQAYPSPDFKLEGSAFVVHGERELQTPDPDGPAQNSLKNQEEKYDPITATHVNLRGRHLHSIRNSSEWKLFLSDRRAVYRRQVKDPSKAPLTNVEAREDDYEYGAQFIHAMEITDANTARAGVTANRWTAPNGKQSYVGFRQDVASYALVLADEHRIGPWTIDAGARYARSYMYDYSGHAFDAGGKSTNLRAVENEWENPVLTGILGATLMMNERNSLYSQLGAGQRRPGPGSIEPDGGTPDIEQRLTGDAGWIAQLGEKSDGLLKLGGFVVYRGDAIVRVNQTGTDSTGQEFYFSGNQDIRQYGLEAEGKTPSFWEGRLALNAGLTWMNSESRLAGGSFENYKEIPSLILSGGLQANVSRWDAGVFLKHVGHYENFRFAQDKQYHDLGDYWDLAAVVGMRFGPEKLARIYAAADNILNEKYSTVVGWSDAGIRFRAGVEATF